jgi:uncharacterized DUF497 family protein
VRWSWNLAKNRDNKRKHGLSFETAQLVFDDPHALTRADPFPHEDRWQTMGVVSQVTLLVVHTWPDSETEGGRIISARKATAHERRAYEEGEF